MFPFGDYTGHDAIVLANLHISWDRTLSQTIIESERLRGTIATRIMMISNEPLAQNDISLKL